MPLVHQHSKLKKLRFALLHSQLSKSHYRINTGKDRTPNKNVCFALHFICTASCDVKVDLACSQRQSFFFSFCNPYQLPSCCFLSKLLRAHSAKTLTHSFILFAFEQPSSMICWRESKVGMETIEITICRCAIRVQRRRGPYTQFRFSAFDWNAPRSSHKSPGCPWFTKTKQLICL